MLSPVALQALQRNRMPPYSPSSEGDEITVLSKCLMTFFCCLNLPGLLPVNTVIQPAAMHSVIQHTFIIGQLCDLKAHKDTVGAFKKLTQSISEGD